MKKAQEAWAAGNRTEAMNYYQEALALKPDNVDALNSLGVIYEELGFSAKAEEQYLSAISIDRRFLPTYSNLGFLYWNQNDDQKAIYYFEKRVEWGNPSDPWVKQAQKAIETIKAKKSVNSYQAKVKQ